MDHLKSVYILLVLLPPLSSCLCPIQCQCSDSQEGYQADCNFSHLNSNINLSSLLPSNITSLRIGCNVTSRFTSALQLWMFRELHELSNITIYNYLFSYIDKDVFADLNNLEELGISNALNLTIHPRAFVHIPSLRILKLRFNKIRIIPNGLLTNLSRLEKLDISHNDISQLPDDFLIGCSYIRYLDISHNFITGLPLPKEELKNFYSLHASNTLLSDISLLEHPGLKLLVINNSSLTAIPSRLCGKNSKLEEIRLKQNSITMVPRNIFQNCSKLQLLDLSANNISILFNRCFTGLGLLSELYISDNNISTLGGFTFYETQFLRNLDLSSNSLSTIEFLLLFNLITLNLEGNNLKSVSLYSPKLIDLNIAHNQLTNLSLGVTYSLKFLDAQHNFIDRLDSFTFPLLTSTINLSNNRIKTIRNGTFRFLLYLNKVDLRNNKIVTLSRSNLSYYSKHQLPMFYISGNPLQCNCTLSWLFLTPSVRVAAFYFPGFGDLGIATCSDHREQLLSLDRYVNDFCRNKTLLHIPNDRHLVGISINLSIILLVFIAGTISYVYRIEIQILLFVRFGSRILLKKNRLDEEDKLYDAFVSYHSSRDDFVVNEMLPRLEGINPPYKLCIHCRDFLAGAAIVDNITEAIDNSKKTIILLDNNFLTSEWCRFEFQAAHFEALSNKMDSLIVVLLEEINQDGIDGGLKLYIKTRTYLKYDDPRFWDKLRIALPEIKEVDIVNEEEPG